MTVRNYMVGGSPSRVGRRAVLRGATLGSFGLAAAGLLGCSSAPKSSAPTKDTTALATGGQPSQRPRGGTLTPAGSFSVASPPGTDPILSSDGRVMTHAALVYSSMFKDAALPNSDATAWSWQLEPDLALSAEQPDDLTNVYKIRPGARWQNVSPLGGREVTAEDVVWTFNAYLQTKSSPTASALESVAKLEATDAHTVVVHRSKPDPSFQAKISSRWVWILPKEIGTADGNFLKRSAGSGPFIMQEMRDGVGATYVRNPTYYDQTRPYVDKVNINVMADEVRIQAAMLSGDVDLWREASDDNVKTILATRKSIKQFTFPNGPFYLAFRSDKPPFNDVRVRQAVMLAIDFKALAGRFGGEAGRVEATFCDAFKPWALPAGQWGEGGKFHGTRDIAESKRLLGAAGFANGLRSFINLNEAYQSRVNAPIAAAIAPMAAEAGIGLDIKLIPTAAYAGVLAGTGAWDGCLVAGLVRFLDPDDLLRYLNNPGPRAVAHIQDPALEKMIAAQRVEMNPDKRKQIIQDIDKYNLVQNYLAPLISTTAFDLVQSRVGGYFPRPTTHLGQAQGMWLNS